MVVVHHYDKKALKGYVHILLPVVSDSVAVVTHWVDFCALLCTKLFNKWFTYHARCSLGVC